MFVSQLAQCPLYLSDFLLGLRPNQRVTCQLYIVHLGCTFICIFCAPFYPFKFITLIGYFFSFASSCWNLIMAFPAFSPSFLTYWFSFYFYNPLTILVWPLQNTDAFQCFVARWGKVLKLFPSCLVKCNKRYLHNK